MLATAKHTIAVVPPGVGQCPLRPISTTRPACGPASSQFCVLENLTKVVSHRVCKARWREVEQFGKGMQRASHVNGFRQPAINLSERTVRLREHSINWE